MMTYLVPVDFRVEANSADEATTLVEQILNTCNAPHLVNQGCRESVSDVKISPELAEFLDDAIQGNDNDTSGWETDLDWCLQTTEDNETVKKELEALAAQVGGAVKAANFSERQ